MYIYRITFSDSTTVQFRANSPKQAWNEAGKVHKKEVTAIKYLRG